MRKRVRKKDISGEVKAEVLERVCQRGEALDWAMVWKARPMRPETGAVRKPEETSETMTRSRQIKDIEIIA